MSNDLILKLKLLLFSIRTKGIIKTFTVSLHYLQDFWFDFTHNTDTMSWISLNDLKIESDNIEDGIDYQPTLQFYFKKVMKSLDLDKECTFVDVGCGKGRVLMLAAEYGFKKVIGLEFSHELVQITHRNLEIFSRKHKCQTEFHVIKVDAADYKYDEIDIFYFFNPFGESTLKKVLSKIVKSVRKHKRKDIFIIYCNPIWGHIIENYDFQNIKEFVNPVADIRVYKYINPSSVIN